MQSNLVFFNDYKGKAWKSSLFSDCVRWHVFMALLRDASGILLVHFCFHFHLLPTMSSLPAWKRQREALARAAGWARWLHLKVWTAFLSLKLRRLGDLWTKLVEITTWQQLKRKSLHRATPRTSKDHPKTIQRPSNHCLGVASDFSICCLVQVDPQLRNPLICPKANSAASHLTSSSSGTTWARCNAKMSVVPSLWEASRSLANTRQTQLFNEEQLTVKQHCALRPQSTSKLEQIVPAAINWKMNNLQTTLKPSCNGVAINCSTSLCFH